MSFQELRSKRQSGRSLQAVLSKRFPVTLLVHMQKALIICQSHLLSCRRHHAQRVLGGEGMAPDRVWSYSTWCKSEFAIWQPGSQAWWLSGELTHIVYDHHPPFLITSSFLPQDLFRAGHTAGEAVRYCHHTKMSITQMYAALTQQEKASSNQSLSLPLHLRTTKILSIAGYSCSCACTRITSLTFRATSLTSPVLSLPL